MEQNVFLKIINNFFLKHSIYGRKGNLPPVGVKPDASHLPLCNYLDDGRPSRQICGADVQW